MVRMLKQIVPFDILPQNDSKLDWTGIGMASNLKRDETNSPTPPPETPTLGEWWKENPGGVMSARLAAVSLFVNHVSVTDIQSMDLLIIRSESAGALSRTEWALTVDTRRLCAGPGLRLTSPDSRSRKAGRKLRRERGRGRSFLLQQIWRVGRAPSDWEREGCMYIPSWVWYIIWEVV